MKLKRIDRALNGYLPREYLIVDIPMDSKILGVNIVNKTLNILVQSESDVNISMGFIIINATHHSFEVDDEYIYMDTVTIYDSQFTNMSNSSNINFGLMTNTSTYYIFREKTLEEKRDEKINQLSD